MRQGGSGNRRTEPGQSWGGSTAGPPPGKTVGASHGVGLPRASPSDLLPAPQHGNSQDSTVPGEKPQRQTRRGRTGMWTTRARQSLEASLAVHTGDRRHDRDTEPGHTGLQRMALFVTLKTRRTADVFGSGAPTGTAPRGGARRPRTPRP